MWDSNWTRPFFSLPNDKEKRSGLATQDYFCTLVGLGSISNTFLWFTSIVNTSCSMTKILTKCIEFLYYFTILHCALSNVSIFSTSRVVILWLYVNNVNIRIEAGSNTCRGSQFSLTSCIINSRTPLNVGCQCDKCRYFLSSKDSCWYSMVYYPASYDGYFGYCHFPPTLNVSQSMSCDSGLERLLRYWYY